MTDATHDEIRERHARAVRIWTATGGRGVESAQADIAALLAENERLEARAEKDARDYYDRISAGHKREEGLTGDVACLRAEKDAAEGREAALRDELSACIQPRARDPLYEGVVARAMAVNGLGGFGAMMNSVANLWEDANAAGLGGVPGAEMTVGPCRLSVERTLADTQAAATARDARLRAEALREAAGAVGAVIDVTRGWNQDDVTDFLLRRADELETP